MCSEIKTSSSLNYMPYSYLFKNAEEGLAERRFASWTRLHTVGITVPRHAHRLAFGARIRIALYTDLLTY
jgi:hypothetical protein